MRSGLFLVPMVVLAVSLSACASVEPLTGTASAPTAGVAQVAIDTEYRLGSGDKVRVTTFGEEDLTGDFVVSTTGKISFPWVGDIDVLRMTGPELQDKLRTSLANGFLKDPRVTVEVLSYRPFYILGEVNKPGEYPYSGGLTALNAVARAEGFTYRANQKKVYIRRAGSTLEEVQDLTTTTVVGPGDTVRIGERYF